MCTSALNESEMSSNATSQIVILYKNAITISLFLYNMYNMKCPFQYILFLYKNLVWTPILKITKKRKQYSNVFLKIILCNNQVIYYGFIHDIKQNQGDYWLAIIQSKFFSSSMINFLKRMDEVLEGFLWNWEDLTEKYQVGK